MEQERKKTVKHIATFIPIPNYLKDIAKIESNKKDSITLKIVCTCGCNIFQVYENKLIKSDEQIKYEKEINDFEKRCKWRGFSCKQFKDGEFYAYRRNIFGIIVDKVHMPANNNLDTTEIIKIKCNSCGKEYILFDSRFNGYDAMETTDLIKKTYNFNQKRIRNTADNLVKIKINIRNYETLDEFIEASGIQADNEFYANAFGWIKITGIIPNQENKHITIFEKETQ